MKVLFFGDSITDMGRYRDHELDVFSYGEGFVFLSALNLDKDQTNKYEIINKGISGNRIIDLESRYVEDVINQKPDVITILIGVNDVWHGLRDAKLKVTNPKFYFIYTEMIKNIKKELPNVKIILMEPFFVEGKAVEFDLEGFAGVYKKAKVVKKVAKENDLTFVPLQKAINKACIKYGNEKVLYDGVHPNVIGAEVISKEWLKAFNKIK